jgi:N-acetylglucosaminyldiphosphoundecaprenol N-acetyl-beta-D-mannosaminyltransferase
MKNKTIPASAYIHGIRLVNLSLTESLIAVEAALIGKNPTRISFVNADCVNIASTDEDYRHLLQTSDWVFIDGIGMRIAGKMMDQPVRDNVNGTDMFPLLCQSMADSGKSLYLLGAKPGVAEDVAAWAKQKYPNLRIAGTQHGYYTANEEIEVIEKIRQSKADILLVAMGVPFQEKWIHTHMDECSVTIAMGVGGLFDFYSGRIPRAPLWMRKAGLEWFFRFMQEPGRLWQRYLVGNGVFLVRILMDWINVHLHKNRGSL